MKVSRRIRYLQSKKLRLYSPSIEKKKGKAASGKLEIPRMDLGEKQGRFVLLLGIEPPSNKVELIAWNVERGEAGLVPSHLRRLIMPPRFRPVDSCGGFVCGIYSRSIGEFSNWKKIKVAVSHPATGYQVKLPPLDISHLSVAKVCSADREFADGRLRLRMTPPTQEGELFCVHLTTSYLADGVDTVHSFNTRRWCWESSRSFSGEPVGRELAGDFLFRHWNVRSYDVATGKWMAIAGPEGEPWYCAFPVPEAFAGSKYSRVIPFRYGDRVMASCFLSSGEFVLLELLDGDEGWKVVVSASFDSFRTSSSFRGCFCNITVYWPVVSGDLLVLPFYCRPVVFNLKHRVWVEIPPLLAASNLYLYAACIYDPGSQVRSHESPFTPSSLPSP